MKTSELTGAALERAVAQAWYGKEYDMSIPLFHDGLVFAPSTNWAHGGPIIERELINVYFSKWDEVDSALPVWIAEGYRRPGAAIGFGSTPLIAAMRCYVASVLGDEVDVPEELTQGATA